MSLAWLVRELQDRDGLTEGQARRRVALAYARVQRLAGEAEREMLARPPPIDLPPRTLAEKLDGLGGPGFLRTTREVDPDHVPNGYELLERALDARRDGEAPAT